MNCLVVDDNKIARMTSVNLLKQSGMVTVVGECTNGTDAYNFVTANSVDLLLLDIEMPGMSGIELLKVLQAKPIVIFYTSTLGYAHDVFNVNVADYIVKPIALPRLVEALQKAKEIFDNRNAVLASAKERHLFIKEKRAIIKLDTNEILWMEARGDYVAFHTAKKKHLVNISIRELESRLDNTQFVRIHRSFIVAMSKVDYLEDNCVYINGTALPISETYRQSLHAKLNLL